MSEKYSYKHFHVLEDKEMNLVAEASLIIMFFKIYLRVQLIQRWVQVELIGVKSGLLSKHGVHVLVRDHWHTLDILNSDRN